MTITRCFVALLIKVGGAWVWLFRGVSTNAVCTHSALYYVLYGVFWTIFFVCLLLEKTPQLYNYGDTTLPQALQPFISCYYVVPK